MILAFFKKKKRKRKKTNIYNADSEVYNDLLQTYLINSIIFLEPKRSKIDSKCDPVNLIHDEHD